jgi:hypothetical protein
MLEHGFNNGVGFIKNKKYSLHSERPLKNCLIRNKRRDGVL